ncbi:MAG: UDP-N-acetylglucosamine 1-carboxyvinyltransferase [Nitrospirae bacterium]|nr:UDP-N-acetylglucosamine 1-carboxyvinyltransferase [Nitrospirota bacterium]MBI4839051.1 UDP-N-acetylglucosamine 1-carboxyvinyltransferase [Nitrospirota bacterium]
MEKLVIEGGVPLRGEVNIGGAKNAALPVMTASILSPGENIVSNVPNLKDIATMGKLLARLGIGFQFSGDKVTLKTDNITSVEAPYDLVRTMRASVLILCPLVARMGEAKVSLPGGCAIGARPINLHLMGLEKMGAEIHLTEGYVHVKARRLKGASIYFDIPTVTGTENLMMAASLADGVTMLENAAMEPEVVDLANVLIKMGAEIQGAGTSVIRINGVENLKPFNYRIIPDRIEAGTFLAAAGITGGDIKIKNCNFSHLDAMVIKLKEAGLIINQESDGVRVKGPERLKPVDVKTMPYPGFPTDMQAQFMTLMSIADGTSLITESIFENRFMHVAELKRMGANIKIQGATATVRGIPSLTGAPVMATDLRASASLVIAGLAAKGTTVVDRVYHLDRGYEQIEEKLKPLGAKIKRIR